LLAKLDSRNITTEYKQLSDKVKYTENERQLLISLENIFEFMQNFTKVLKEYYTEFETAGNLRHMHHLAVDTESLSQYLEKLDSYKLSAEQLKGKIAVDPKTAEFIYDSNPAIAEPPFNNSGSTIREKIIQALPLFDKLFSGLNSLYANLLHNSRHYLKKQTFDGDVYEPHIALVISFLHLYSYLQKPVNGLIKKHLDYYYQEIIGIKFKKEILDDVHLVLEPVDPSSPFILNKGTQVIAEIGDNPEKLLYALVNSVQLSGTQIKELKTLFVSNKTQVKEKKNGIEGIKECQVFKADNPVPHTATFLKEKDSFNTWPLLGEEQSELPLQQKTMTAADMGLLVASPLFYQADGQRNFWVKFFIQKQALKQFELHVEHLANALGRSPEVLLLEMLNQAFVITITGSTGWISIEDYGVSYSSVKNPDSFMEVKFKLGITEESVAVYNCNLHGYNFDNVQWPVLQLQLNNFSFHHPYTFLSYFIIERIAIKVDVKESKQFKLRNNLGDLYSGSPFQPFGPIPTIGSYLDINNPNIFNRYTTNFCLQFYWYNLPRGGAGFAGYYAGYNYPYTNESFKIQLNSTADAKAAPAAEEQQVFQLFENNLEKDGLKACTRITNIDFKRIKFNNAPVLDQAQEVTEPYLKQGTVRLELIAPQEAFGHRLYPQVFTETVVHNSKRFATNRSIPNQPYVPVVKSLSIDYTLEHSEQTNGASYTNEEEVLLIHLYPFGYDTFYTGKNAEHNLFVPPPDQESNLFIGLNELFPGQELSLFFQLSEANFHHTVHDPEEINWSHLSTNKWVPIPKAGVVLDTTGNFVKSGIITLKIPDGIEKKNTILNPDLYWIRASLPGESSVRSKVIAVFAQGAMAVRVPEQYHFPDHSYTLPPGAIKGFKEKNTKIKDIRQFFPSFNGQSQETYQQYNIRVSERLRHKQRFLSILDITQAVLNAFPQILMVKCYSTDKDSNMILPGVDIHLIVIPKERADGGFINQEPKVNLSVLYDIKQFITQAISGFVKVEVGNPIYEKIMVVTRVQFKNTDQVRQSNGYYLKLMNEDIKKYISEWLYNPHCDFQIGSKIYVSEILNYLQQRDYIAYITGFSLIHFYKTWNKEDDSYHAKITDTSVDKIDSLKGSIPGAILIPAEEHLLTVIDKPMPYEAKESGIGEFSVGSGLLINQSKAKETKATGALQPPEDLYDFTVYNN